MRTRVDGIEFRSKTEAAWYLVLDAYGLDPVYEPETFEISPAWTEPGNEDHYSCWYMPDFSITLTGLLPHPFNLVKTMVEIKASVDGESQDIAKACILGYTVPTLIIVGWPLHYRAVVVNERHKGCPRGIEVVFRSNINNKPVVSQHGWFYGSFFPDENWLEMDEHDLFDFMPKHKPAAGTLEGDIARRAWNATQWNPKN